MGRDLTDSANIAWDFSNPGQAIPQLTADDSRGTAGQVLTSQGAGGLPTYQDAAAAGGGGGDFQRFNSSGTWNKPDLDAASRVLIKVWGGGGAGRKGGSNNYGGGGGGAYSERWMLLSELGASETVTVGAGGAGVTAANTSGATGGTSSFGSHVSAYGGAGGSSTGGGGGGGPLSAGNSVTPGSPTITGLSDGGVAGVSSVGNPGIYHGGGGGAGSGTGGDSVFGGGGGGGVNNGAGGTSVNGGNGGAGSSGGSATAGTQPAGGGGGTNSGTTSGAGGNGRVDVLVFPPA